MTEPRKRSPSCLSATGTLPFTKHANGNYMLPGSEPPRLSQTQSYSRGTPHTGSNQGPTSATIMEKDRRAPSRGCHSRCRYWRMGRLRGGSRWRAQICPNRARGGASPIQG